MGVNANGASYGAAMGYNTNGSSDGAAMGINANGSNYGAAVGYDTNGSNYGAAVGGYMNGSNYGAAVGNNTNGSAYGVAIGCNALGYGNGNLAIGYNSNINGFSTCGAIGYSAQVAAANEIVIGGNGSGTMQDTLIAGNLIFSGTASAPSNSVTPVYWVQTKLVSGTNTYTGRVPFYQ
jgi:hypothetical protein